MKVLVATHIGRVPSYYLGGADDYYARDGGASAWQGRGAEALGLYGEVDPKTFKELLAGKVGDEEVSRNKTRRDSKRRIGIDMTFTALKSVSIQALIGGDKRIIEAHDRAVTRAVAKTEEYAMARNRIDGKVGVERTNNIIVAKFRHETTREIDPDLHTHAVILNLTQRADGKWRALKNDEIVQTGKYLAAVYRSELASGLVELGYRLRDTPDGMFELAHISREQILAFSTRSKQVEKKLAEMGLTRETATYRQKRMAAFASRRWKGKVDKEVAHTEWRDRAREMGIEFDGWQRLGPGDSVEKINEVFYELGADKAVRFAIEKLTERQSIIGHHEIMTEALKHGGESVREVYIGPAVERAVESGGLVKEVTLYRKEIDKDSIPQTEVWWTDWAMLTYRLDRIAAAEKVRNAIKDGMLAPVEWRYTTEKLLKWEKKILECEESGRQTLKPILSAEVVQERLAGSKLNAGQRASVEAMLSTTNRYVGVQGSAGSGKTKMMEQATALFRQEGYDVRALASYSGQVKELRKQVEANTLESFLVAKNKDISDKTVLVIDEAGVVPARNMYRLMSEADKVGARVVFLGDVNQTKAIESGKPFEQLQRNGMQTVLMSEILRQKNIQLKRAVELAADGKTREALHNVSVIEISDGQSRRRAIADAYVQSKDRENTLIISGENIPRRELNDLVRESLGLVGKGVVVDALTRRDLTQEERKHSRYYHVGDVIQPEHNYDNGLKRGKTYEIVDTGPNNKLTVEGPDGEVLAFCPQRVAFIDGVKVGPIKLSVYEPRRAELTVGDVVKVTHNNPARDLANGERFTVVSIDSRRVVLDGGGRRVQLPTDIPVHLDHAYAWTAHGAQGLTCERVLVDIPSVSRTTKDDVFYVDISRAKHDAQLFTDDLTKLPYAISRENVKHAALELRR